MKLPVIARAKVVLLCADGDCELAAVAIVSGGVGLCGAHGLEWLLRHPRPSQPNAR